MEITRKQHITPRIDRRSTQRILDRRVSREVLQEDRQFQLRELMLFCALICTFFLLVYVILFFIYGVA